MSFARSWLRAHGEVDPDQAGMEELKQTNPEAYGIVQALITKKSLGLLNPRHPNAFGGYQDAPSKDAMSTQVVDAPQAPLAAVSVETQHSSASQKDWLNWKPNQDDDSLVSGALGEVAQTKSDAVQPETQKPDAGLVAVKVDAAVPQTQESQGSTNPYLSNLVPAAPIASMSQAGTSVKFSKHNALRSFSWDDDDSSPAPSRTLQEGVPEAPKGNALVNFLR